MKSSPTLILYSGGQSRRNSRLHRELVRLAHARFGARTPLKMAYLPFCADGAEVFFGRFVRRYSRYGVSEFCCLRADSLPSEGAIREALSAHIVYLAGGNTFYFLDALRRSGLLAELRKFAERGGILAGLSAGAHLMTPHIALAGARGLDPDANEVALSDLRSLGLAPFEILPHFEGRERALRAYSRTSRYPIFACPDGTGVVLEGARARTIGRGVRVYVGGRDVTESR